ncbi:MAG: LapA family protein [bacterium]
MKWNNKKWKNISKYKLIGIIVVLILLVIFILQNTDPVSLTIFFYTFNLSSALLIMICLIIGFLCGLLGPKIVAKKKLVIKNQERHEKG